jgi:hypothetical protein
MKVSFSVVLLFSVLAFAGCIREPDLSDLAKHMVVITEYDEDQINETENIFDDYTTFYLRRDTIGYVYNHPNADTVLIDGINGPGDFVSPTVDEIELNITAAGFNYVDKTANPDFAVKVAVVENFSFYQSISYYSYSGYYGYYGYYYPIVNTYASNSATFLIEIIDVKNYAANGNKYVVVWRAYIGDLIVTQDLKGKTLEAINTAFEQSPFIKKTL